jgi:serine protease Do
MLRRKPLHQLCFALLLLPVLLSISQELDAQIPESDFSRIEAEQLRQDVRRMISVARDRVFPALVHIEVVTAYYEGGRETLGRRQGSGTLITPEGHVLTNQHVVQRGRQFRCTLAERQTVSAELVGEDPLTDLAVLKINLAELPEQDRLLPIARFGDSDKLETGDYVMAMGSPYSLSRSVTLGIVSNPARVLPSELLGGNQEMELEPGQSTGLFTLWIQHDALINPGNSGGPLVDLMGDIVGINEMGGAAIGFAIPSNLARKVATNLIRYGEVPRSWIGLSFRPVADAGLAEGVLVDSVAADSPAAHAGIRTGDVILEISGEAISVRFPEEVPLLASRISGEPIGARLQVAYRREGSVHRAEIVTERMLRDRGEESSFPGWGFTAQEVTPKIARELSLSAVRGSLVTGVRSGSPAHLAQPPLAPGDLIRSIGDSPVQTLEDLTGAYSRMQAVKSEAPVLLAFDRRGKSYLTLLKARPASPPSVTREILKPWIGIATQPILGDMAEVLGSPAAGYRITRVYPDTAAAAAGLRVGDLILSISGERLTPRGLEDAGLLDLKVRSLEIGQSIPLTVLRDGQVQEKTVALEKTLVAPPEAHRETDSGLGLTAREITFFDRDENHWGENIRGVIVEKVEPAGSAGLAGLLASDLIQQIGRREVRDLQSYRDALVGVGPERPKRIEIVVLRGARTHLLYLESLSDSTIGVLADEN